MPPVEGSNNRLRGFYPETISTDADVKSLYDNFQDGVSQAVELGIDRLSIRHIGTRATMAALVSTGIKIEGVLPIATPEEDSLLVYTGWNSETRQMDESYINRHTDLLGQVASIMPAGNLASDPRHRGYRIQTLEGHATENERRGAVSRFLGLYATFGFNKADVEELVLNQGNTIAYLEDAEGRIVSTVLAESAQIEVGGHEPINIYEMTEATTLRELEGQGLYRAVSGHLTRHLQSENFAGTPAHLIYGESNLSSPGVIYAARRNGRKFAANDGLKYGVSDSSFGILPQNYGVSDGREVRPYNDFALTYVDLRKKE